MWLTFAGGIVYQDVENIEPLSKDDMLDFYTIHINPSSPRRIKLATHLIAQSTPADLAAKTSPSEKQDKLVATLAQMLEQLGLENVNSTDLKKRMVKVDLSKGEVGGIIDAMGGYMKEGLGVAAEQVEQVMEQGKAALGQILPSLGIVAQEGPAARQVNGEVVADAGEARKTGSRTIVIEDVKAFKAGMPLTAGARAAKDSSEFEELAPRL